MYSRFSFGLQASKLAKQIAPTAQRAAQPGSETKPTFQNSEPDVPANANPSGGLDSDTSPEDAGAYIVQFTEGSTIVPPAPSATARVYAEHVAEHQDDPEWLAQFFSVIGSDLASEYSDLSLNSSSYILPGSGAFNSFDAEAANDALQGVPAALDTLYQSGSLSMKSIFTYISITYRKFDSLFKKLATKPPS